MMLKVSTVSHVALFALFISPACGAVSIVRRGPPEAQPTLSKASQPDAHELVVLKSQVVAGTSDAAHASDETNAISATSQMQACAGATCLVIGIVLFLYWRKGPFAVFQIIVYLLALATMKGAVRLVEDRYFFKFPLFITGTHFVCSSLVAFVLLKHDSITTGVKIAVPSLASFTTRFGPIAAAFAVSVAMNNMALVYSTSSFVEMVGATTPLVSVGVVLVMGRPFHMMLLGPCLLVVLGCALTSNGEKRFSFLGLILATGSNVPRAVKGVLQQVVLSADGSERAYSPMEVLGWMCLPASFIMLGWSLVQEGVEPYLKWHQQGLASLLTVALLVSCVNAVILNTSILFVTRHLGAVGAQITSQIKSVLVIVGGMCFLNEQVSRMEIAGFTLVLLGVYTFNDVEARLKAKSEAALKEKGSNHL